MKTDIVGSESFFRNSNIAKPVLIFVQGYKMLKISHSIIAVLAKQSSREARVHKLLSHQNLPGLHSLRSASVTTFNPAPCKAHIILNKIGYGTAIQMIWTYHGTATQARNVHHKHTFSNN